MWPRAGTGSPRGIGHRTLRWSCTAWGRGRPAARVPRPGAAHRPRPGRRRPNAAAAGRWCLDRQEAFTDDNDRLRAVEDLDRRAQRSFDLEDLRGGGVDGLDVADQWQARDSALGGQRCVQLLQVEPEVVHVAVGVVVLVGEVSISSGAVCAVSQGEPPVALADREMAALAVGGRAAAQLGGARRARGSEPSGQRRARGGAEVVGVGRAGGPEALLEQHFQDAGRQDRGVDVAVPRRAPLQRRVLWSSGGGQFEVRSLGSAFCRKSSGRSATAMSGAHG